jgi:hypothetical protein
MLISPASGELLDLTLRTWRLPPADGTDPDSSGAYALYLSVDADVQAALVTGDVTGLTDERLALVHAVQAALDRLAVTDPARHAVLSALLEAPVTADDLDNQPDAVTPSPALAEFVNLRDRHPANPTANPNTAAGAGDIDHLVPRCQGGKTIRANLHSPTRRWHLLKTHYDWTAQRHGTNVDWTSPAGLTYTIQPYDYRLGP